jgi:CRP-like cAMP-binding protein
MVTAKIQAEKIGQILQQETVFGELLLPEERQYLMDRSKVRHVAVGDVLCRQQQHDNRVFILLLGEVEVTESQFAQPIVLAKLKRGEVFGEIAALFKLPRMSTVIVTKPSVVLDIPGDVFEELIIQRPELRDAVWQRYHHRLTMTVLRMVRQFRPLPDSALQSLLERLSLVCFPRDTQIVQAGKPGDALFIIISGDVVVSQQTHAHAEHVARLTAGDYFGEWSLLTGAPCSAEVTAKSDLSVLCIERSDFLRFIQDYPSVRDGIDMVAHNRQARSGADMPPLSDQDFSVDSTHSRFLLQ